MQPLFLYLSPNQMSSWSGGRQFQSRKIVPGLFHQSREAGFCSLFLGYFFDYLYAQHKNQILYVKSTPNPVSANYELFKETFLNPGGIQFVRENTSGWPSILHGQVKQRLTYYTPEHLKELALPFFRLTSEMETQIAEFRAQKGISGPFDLGIHIRTGDKITTGEMKTIPVSAYADQIRKLCTSPSPRIFIMTDNFETIRQLQALADPSWQLFSYTLDRQKGHIQLDFNLSPATQRKADYIQFLAELQVMQETPSLLVTYSSNIGRYLYLTTPKSTSIASLDVKSFVAA